MNEKATSINNTNSLSKRDFALLLKQEILRQMELQISLLGIHTQDLHEMEGILADEFDNATIEEIRGRALRLSEAEQNRFEKLKTALRRIEIAIDHFSWDIFTCSQCGSAIDRKRLIAQPTTVLCCDCKTQQEELERRVHGYAPGRHMWHHNP
ncbi:MAG: hypothetical protein EOM19_07510 [Candidatus Moranbacteria bacterium]|nr:hypothetical protein [Candidatus Moranbacteria bacterium]